MDSSSHHAFVPSSRHDEAHGEVRNLTIWDPSWTDEVVSSHQQGQELLYLRRGEVCPQELYFTARYTGSSHRDDDRDAVVLLRFWAGK